MKPVETDSHEVTTFLPGLIVWRVINDAMHAEAWDVFFERMELTLLLDATRLLLDQKQAE